MRTYSHCGDPTPRVLCVRAMAEVEGLLLGGAASFECCAELFEHALQPCLTAQLNDR